MEYTVQMDYEPTPKTVEADLIRCNTSIMVGLDTNDVVLWALPLKQLKWLERTNG